MGHLCIVNDKTISSIINTGYVSLTGKLGNYPIKTISDIFADALAVRKGDKIYPWLIKSDQNQTSKPLGFKYVFKVAGPPIFVQNDRYPIKIPLEETGFVYHYSLTEEIALDLFEKKILWNAIGKKSLGRGRSLTHQTIQEDSLLESKISSINNQPAVIKLKTKIYPNSKTITISLVSTSRNNNKLPTSISKLDLSSIVWTSGSNFKYEKTLEAWFMQNIDDPCLYSTWARLKLNPASLIWFGNYLPYGVAGKNIDAVALFKENDKYVICAIELKKVHLNAKGCSDAANQVREYGNFLQKAFKSFGLRLYPTKHLVLSLSGKTSAHKPSEKGVYFANYSIVNGSVEICFS